MSESKIQAAIMNMLIINHNVAWAHVTTNGSAKMKGFYVKLGYTGMSDIIGQTRKGKLFAIEVKKPGETPSKNQQDFINMVLDNNGIAGVAESVEDAQELLK